MLSAALRSSSSSSLSSAHQPGSAGLPHSASASLLSAALLSTSPASSGRATPHSSLNDPSALACEDEALELMCGGGGYFEEQQALPGRRASRDSTFSTRSSHDAAGAPGAAAAASACPLPAGRAVSASAACSIPAGAGSAAADGGYGGGGGFASLQIARSCPKPISMPRRSSSRPSGLLDDLDEFVPPHLMASSLMDNANVSESLARKGSAVLRLRAGVLRRTGYLEGHTETLRSSSNVAGSLAQ